MSSPLNVRVEREGNALIFKRVEVANRGFYDVRIEIKDGKTPREAFEENIVRIRQLAAQVFQQCAPESSKIIYTTSPESCSHREVTNQTREIWQNLFAQPEAQSGPRIAIPEALKIPVIPQPAIAMPPAALPTMAPPVNPTPTAVQPAAPQAEEPTSEQPDDSSLSSLEAEEKPSPVAVPSEKQFEFDCSAIKGNESTDTSEFFDEVATQFKNQHKEFKGIFPDCNYTSLQQVSKKDPAFNAYCRFLKNPILKGDKEVDLIRDLIRAFYKAALAKRRGTGRKGADMANEIISFISSRIDSKEAIKYLISNK